MSSENGRDILDVKGAEKLGAKGKAFWKSVHKQMVGWEDHAIKIDHPGAYQRPSVDASVDSVDAILNAQKEMLRVMAEKGYPADQIKSVIEAIGKKSTDENAKSTDDRQTKEDLATLERRRERDRKYQETRRRKVKETKNSSVDAKAEYISSSLPFLEETINKKESKDSGIRARVLFPKFWAVYPKRSGGNPRKPAEDQFVIAVKNGHDPERIIAGAEEYGRSCQRSNIVGTAYVAHARTWLRQQRWNDDYSDHGGQNVRSRPGLSGPNRQGSGKPNGITAAIDTLVERFERQASDERQVREADPGVLSNGRRERS